MITNETTSSMSAFLEAAVENKSKILFQYLKRQQKMAFLSFSSEYEYDESKGKKYVLEDYTTTLHS